MSYDILFQQALSAHRQGRFDEAEHIYRQILETAPEHPDVLNLLGLIAQAKGVHNEAINLFYRAIQKAPKHAPFYFNIALSLDSIGKPIEALEQLLKAADMDPDTKEIYNKIGLIQHKTNHIEASQEAFLKAITIDPDYSEAKTNLAMTYYSKDPNKGLAFLEEISKQYPNEPLCRYFLSTMLYDEGRFDEAEHYAQEADKLAPDSDEVKLILGLLALRKNNSEDAELYFIQALNNNPRNVAAMLNLANLETNKKDFKTAEYRYRKALDLIPNNFDAHINFANMLYQADRLSESLEEYRQAIIINPQSAEASNNLGIILKDIKEYEEALGLFINAFIIDPKREEYSINIAETLIIWHRQAPENAKKVAENWLKMDETNVFAKHLLASLKGENVEDSKVYSEKLFDNFADNYELVLEKIAYSLPKRIRDLAGNVKDTIVDLGCGSGLVGQALKTPENQIIGVDLSQKMLNLAAEKKVYTKLIKSDAESFMQQHPQADLIIAADVFGYIGNLANIINLLKGYNLIFSIEKLLSDTNQDYKLTETGRYQHSAEYIEKLLQTAGFTQIIPNNIVLRQENGQDVNGILYFAKP